MTRRPIQPRRPGYVYTASYVEHLASGRPLSSGDLIDSADLSPDDQRLIDNGSLIEHCPADPPRPARRRARRPDPSDGDLPTS
jgi:hypothetical protein